MRRFMAVINRLYVFARKVLQDRMRLLDIVNGIWFLCAKSNYSGICVGAFKDAREARELQDSAKQAKGHRRRNSVAV